MPSAKNCYSWKRWLWVNVPFPSIHMGAISTIINCYWRCEAALFAMQGYDANLWVMFHMEVTDNEKAKKFAEIWFGNVQCHWACVKGASYLITAFRCLSGPTLISISIAKTRNLIFTPSPSHYSALVDPFICVCVCAETGHLLDSQAGSECKRSVPSALYHVASCHCMWLTSCSTGVCFSNACWCFIRV